jgi:hypothetical protein
MDFCVIVLVDVAVAVSADVVVIVCWLGYTTFLLCQTINHILLFMYIYYNISMYTRLFFLFISHIFFFCYPSLSFFRSLEFFSMRTFI